MKNLQNFLNKILTQTLWVKEKIKYKIIYLCSMWLKKIYQEMLLKEINKGTLCSMCSLWLKKIYQEMLLEEINKGTLCSMCSLWLKKIYQEMLLKEINKGTLCSMCSLWLKKIYQEMLLKEINKGTLCSMCSLWLKKIYQEMLLKEINKITLYSLYLKKIYQEMCLKEINKITLCLICLVTVFTKSQTILQAPESNNKKQTDTQSIIFKPGFIVTATTGSQYHAFIDANLNGLADNSESYLLNITENYVFLTEPLIPTNDVNTLKVTEKKSSVMYFDGLGREKQAIAIGASPSGKDIVTHIGYDAFGRKTKEFLPFPTSQSTGSILQNAETATINYYAMPTSAAKAIEPNTNPFAEKTFELSPLNRVLAQAAPGADWKTGSGHEIKFDYQTNIAGEVRLFRANTTWNPTTKIYDTSFSETAGGYPPNTLYKTIVKDENTTGISEEFKNKEGQIILKRTYNSNIKHDTYYVFDIYQNLTYVIPPALADQTAVNSQLLDELGFQYKYDHKNRPVERKLPSKQWEFMVYDKLDRLVLSGPVFSPFMDLNSSGWLINKFDKFNRTVLTAWIPATINSTTRANEQTARNALAVINETKTATDITLNGISFRYSNSVAPTAAYHVLTVNYYDDYKFNGAPNTIPTTIENQAVKTSFNGGLTGNLTRLLENSTNYNIEIAYTLYDQKARPIRAYKSHPTLNLETGGYTQLDTKIDFRGKTEYAITKHKRISNESETAIKEVFSYDVQERIITHEHQINAGAIEKLTQNKYDELGQLLNKNIGGTTTGIGLQTVDYLYNIRGWLTNINNVNSLANDLFAFKINYNNISEPINGINKLFNGNISETNWISANDNILRKYFYKYDNLNRLTDAISKDNLALDRYSEKGITYDKNGNILTLTRTGNNPSSASAIVIDNLKYVYSLNSNKLLSVTDSTNSSEGFNNGNSANANDYTYDLNGNMISDLNKNITKIIYNHLNLPTKITIGTNNIEYIYTANGTKITKKAGTDVTNYLGNFIYTNKILSMFSTAEGHVKNASKTSATLALSYVYLLDDHLGNIRLSFSDTDKNGTISTAEIIETNDYYPFGLTHKGYGKKQTFSTKPIDLKFKMFQGQEFTDEFGLNVNTWKYRTSDPTTGRFWQIDPLAEKYAYNGTYNFSENRLLDGKELEGTEVVLLKDIKKNEPILRAINSGQYADNPNTKTIHVFAHGNPRAFYNETMKGDGTIDTGSDLNNVLNQGSDLWKNSKDKNNFTIILHSCRTGKCTVDKDGNKINSIAQDISASKEMKGVTIIAPNERDGFSAKGKEIGPQVTKNTDHNGDYLPGTAKSEHGKQTNQYGKWNSFQNGQMVNQQPGNIKPTGDIKPKVEEKSWLNRIFNW